MTSVMCWGCRYDLGPEFMPGTPHTDQRMPCPNCGMDIREIDLAAPGSHVLALSFEPIGAWPDGQCYVEVQRDGESVAGRTGTGFVDALLNLVPALTDPANNGLNEAQPEVQAAMRALRMTAPLNPSHVPESVRPLIPLAEQWGIGDDIYRDHAVKTAAPADLEELLDALAGPVGDAMYDWLAGPASEEPVTKEYAAFTAMSMAADLAKFVQERRPRAADREGPAT